MIEDDVLIVGRASRLLVVLSAAVALAVQGWLGGWAGHLLEYWVAGGFFIGLAGARLLPVPAIGLVLIAGFVLPALLRFWPGHVGPPSESIWLSAMLGLSVGLTGTRPWSLPVAWRVALAICALAAALSWPIIAAREVDFVLSQLLDTGAHVTHRGIAPAGHIVWILYASLTMMVSILWMDAIFALRATRDARTLERAVIWPCLVGAGVSLAAALVQMLVNIEFLNSGFFAFLRRASGLTHDANVFGMLLVLWTAAGGTVALRRGRAPALLVMGIAAIGAVGVWGSGSRTALLAFAVVCTGMIAAAAMRIPGRKRWQLVIAVATLGAVASAALLLARETGGPIARLFEQMESAGKSPAAIVRELWNRGGYGATAVALIRAYPLSGVGIGSFHALVIDYTWAFAGVELSPDNAQNWYRHLVVEMGGLVAALWFWWVACLLVLIHRSVRAGPTAVFPVSSAIVGFLAASMLGVPSQQGIILVSVVTLAAWLWLEVYGCAPTGAVKRRYWAAGATVLALFLAATTHAAVTSLRVPQRAAETGWPYQYGLSPFERTEPGYIRWMTARHSVAVFERKGRYVLVRFEVRHPDLAERPVAVEVKMQGVSVLRTKLRSRGLGEAYLELKADDPFVRLEFIVGRTFRDPETGLEKGLLLYPFAFVDDVPPDGAWRFR